LGDKKLQTEGKLDKAKGDAHNMVGNAKDAIRNVASSVKKSNTAKDADDDT
jgi:uncharacterized protein YjbJ (UPF0337 family)